MWRSTLKKVGIQFLLIGFAVTFSIDESLLDENITFTLFPEHGIVEVLICDLPVTDFRVLSDGFDIGVYSVITNGNGPGEGYISFLAPPGIITIERVNPCGMRLRE